MTTLIPPRNARLALPLVLATAGLLMIACHSRPPSRAAPVEPSERGTPRQVEPAAPQNEPDADAASTAPWGVPGAAPCCPPSSPRLLRVRRQASS